MKRKMILIDGFRDFDLQTSEEKKLGFLLFVVSEGKIREKNV
jgi:hypothetical protein